MGLTTLSQFNTIMGTRSGNSAHPTQLPEKETAMPASNVKPLSNHVKDLTARKFGRLTVIEFSHLTMPRRDACWKCLCFCGTTTIVQANNLSAGHTVSCGCWLKEKRLKHGHSKGGVLSPEYRCWRSLRNRCLNKNDHGYSRYGGRGISVCARWRHSFPNFLADMGRKPSPEYSIDRIDNDGPYQKSNCRWALRVTQARNRRNNRKLEFRGECLCISEWAERFGSRYQRIAARLQRGWSIEKAITCPSLGLGRPKGWSK